MRQHSPEQRFKTAGARILRSRKLPKDFFDNHDRNHSSIGSLHTSKEKNHSDIFQFTFMAKQHLSLRKSCSQTYESSKQCLFPRLKNTTPQKENKAPIFLPMKSTISKHSRPFASIQCQFKKKLQKISLTHFHRQQQNVE